MAIAARVKPASLSAARDRALRPRKCSEQVHRLANSVPAKNPFFPAMAASGSFNALRGAASSLMRMAGNGASARRQLRRDSQLTGPRSYARVALPVRVCAACRACARGAVRGGRADGWVDSRVARQKAVARRRAAGGRRNTRPVTTAHEAPPLQDQRDVQLAQGAAGGRAGAGGWPC